jgi:hypothetical protein
VIIDRKYSNYNADNKILKIDSFFKDKRLEVTVKTSFGNFQDDMATVLYCI